MAYDRPIRYLVIAALLLLGVSWSVASGIKDSSATGYPNARFMATAQWLKSHMNDARIVIVDVRTDKYFNSKLIPDAVRMPWNRFRYDNRAANMAGVFVGIERAQEILGAHGIARNDTVVLYDSVERDGGATSSYIFWILEVLGHRNIKVLERGIEAWIEAGGKTVSSPRKAEAVLYQAPSDEINPRFLVEADFISARLGDPYYQILDVRSRQEYLGEKPNLGLDGTVLKLGHIPTAYNINYVLNWTDLDTKAMKPYADLLQLYKGLDPNRAVITYCHSARRSAFGYFVLRLMGFADVMLYEASWMEWGNQRYFYPVQTAENIPEQRGIALTEPRGSQAVSAGLRETSSGQGVRPKTGIKDGKDKKSGYISCGG
jgi:thiosulfate/3-mercaptopyruvate sulfurtransferase